MADEAGLTLAIPVQGDWASSSPSCDTIQTQMQPTGKLFNRPSYNSSTDFSLDLERDIFWSPFEEIFNPQAVYSSDKLRTSPRDVEDSQQGKHSSAVSFKVSASTTSLMDDVGKQDVRIKKKSKSVLQESANTARLYSGEAFVNPSPLSDNDSPRINSRSLGHNHHRASYGGMNEEMLGRLRTVDIIRENLRQEGYHNLGSGRSTASFHPNFSVAIGDHVESKQKKSKKQKVLSAFSKLIRCSPLGKPRKKGAGSHATNPG